MLVRGAWTLHSGGPIDARFGPHAQSVSSFVSFEVCARVGDAEPLSVRTHLPLVGAPMTGKERLLRDLLSEFAHSSGSCSCFFR